MLACPSSFHPRDIARTNNRYLDQYLAAAESLGFRTTQHEADPRTWIIHGNGRRLSVRAAILGCNGELARRVASDKLLTHRVLGDHGIPMPDFRYFDSEDGVANERIHKAIDYARGRYPVVAKARTGLQGRNVHANLRNEGELREALESLCIAGFDEFLVEQHVGGREYRVKMFDDEVVGVIEKTAALVTGDGVSTVRQLIDAENRRRRHRSLALITIDSHVTRHLSRSEIGLDDRPAVNERFALTAEITGRYGCGLRDVPTDSVPAAATALFRWVMTATGLRWAGLDYRCEDITDVDQAGRGRVIEINSAPTPMEFSEGLSRPRYLQTATTVLDRYFRPVETNRTG